MAGVLRGREVLVQDAKEASHIHNRGWFGEVQSGGGLRLSMVEAAYLSESGRLSVEANGARLDLPGLLAQGHAAGRAFEIAYIVYRDFRERGYTLKHGDPPETLLLYPRGGAPASVKWSHAVIAFSEQEWFDAVEVGRRLDEVEALGRGLIFAVVDEEGDITHYDVSRYSPSGQMRGGPDRPVKGYMLGERVFLFGEDADAVVKAGCFLGKPMGKALQLSLIEAAALVARGLLTVLPAGGGKTLAPPQFRQAARRLQEDFDIRLKTYMDLQRRGLVVKTGFKYGAHFRVYDSDPEKSHARFLAHAVPSRYRAPWPEVCRAVRLAHGVRKDILFARVNRSVEYIRLGRVRL